MDLGRGFLNRIKINSLMTTITRFIEIAVAVAMTLYLPLKPKEMGIFILYLGAIFYFILLSSKLKTYLDKTLLTTAGIFVIIGVCYNLIFYNIFKVNYLLYFSLSDYLLSGVKTLVEASPILLIAYFSFEKIEKKLKIGMYVVFLLLYKYFFENDYKFFIYIQLSIIVGIIFIILERMKLTISETIISRMIKLYIVLALSIPFLYANFLKTNSLKFLKDICKIKFYDDDTIYLERLENFEIFLNKSTNEIIIKEIK